MIPPRRGATANRIATRQRRTWLGGEDSPVRVLPKSQWRAAQQVVAADFGLPGVSCSAILATTPGLASRQNHQFACLVFRQSISKSLCSMALCRMALLRTMSPLQCRANYSFKRTAAEGLR
jgi:hypothetical protein